MADDFERDAEMPEEWATDVILVRDANGLIAEAEVPDDDVSEVIIDGLDD